MVSQISSRCEGGKTACGGRRGGGPILLICFVKFRSKASAFRSTSVPLYMPMYRIIRVPPCRPMSASWSGCTPTWPSQDLARPIRLGGWRQWSWTLQPHGAWLPRAGL